MKTRDRILKAMYDLVAEHGYDKTSISMICNQLEINKPSIYYCFNSKEDILVTLFDEIVKDMLDIKYEVNFNEHSYKQCLVDGGYYLLDYYANNKTLLKILLEFYIQATRLESLKQSIKEYQAKSNNYMRSILEYGIQNGEFSKDFDIDLNLQLLNSIIQNAEYSLVFDLEYESKKLWKLAIDRMFDQ